jgi:microcystin-dependent protein
MGTPYIGEIRMFAGSFAPAGWEICAGQLVSISENEALFNLIGTTYGGDGQSTFALPDLRSRFPVHQGTGPGLSTYVIGQQAGVESVTLNSNQIPSHSHTMVASSATGTRSSAAGAVLASGASVAVYRPSTAASALAADAMLPTGGSQPHENMHPHLCINFIISLFGIFPTTS